VHLEFSSAVGNNEDVLNFFDFKFRTVADYIRMSKKNL